MSESAVVQLGYDDSAVKAGLARTAREMASTKAKVDKSLTMKPTGGSALRGIGGASMQIQDIAVQLQMGTNAMTVLAQQGSQMASVFGPAGMIVGGAVAIGGALYTAGKMGQEAFTEMLTGANSVSDSITGLVRGGSIEQLSSALGEASTQLKAIAAERENINATFAFLKYAPQTFTGGPDFGERTKSLDEAELKLLEAAMKARQAIFKASEQDLKIIQLKAAGMTEEADILERQVALAKKLAVIMASELPEGLKKTLALHANERAELEYKIEAQKKLNEEFFKMVDEENKRIQDQQAKKQKADEVVQENKAFGNMVDDEWQRIEQEQDAAAERKKATMEQIALELSGLAAQAAGQKDKAAAIQRELDIRQRIKALTDAGLTEQQARLVATREADLREQIEGNGGRRPRVSAAAKRTAAISSMGSVGRLYDIQNRSKNAFNPLLNRNTANAARQGNNRVVIDEARGMLEKLTSIETKLNIE